MHQVIEARPLDQLKGNRKSENFKFIEPTKDVIFELSQLFYDNVDKASPPDVVDSVLAHNSDILMVFQNQKTRRLGAVIILPLTKSGHIALSDDRLDTVNPDLKHVCKKGEKPSAIYIWGVGITPDTTPGFALVMEKFDRAPYTGCPLYAKAAHRKAARLLHNLGFTEGAYIYGSYSAELFAYERDADIEDVKFEGKTSYDSYDPAGAKPNEIGVKVVHNANELSQVFMIRGAAYIGEQGIPYSEDVDGNDYSSTHLIAYVGHEPAACMRMRFFAGFAKIERLAVLPHFRHTAAATRIVKAGIELGKAKGYQRFYGQSELETMAIWRRVGFIQRTEEAVQYKTDRKYYEGDMVTSRHPKPVTPLSGPYVILRPEGQWHREGPLDG